MLIPRQPTFLDFLSFRFPHLRCPLIRSFLILSSCVTLHIHRSIRISVNLFSCTSFNGHFSASHTGVLYTFPCCSCSLCVSHNTPYTLFQCFHPLCALWVFISCGNIIKATLRTLCFCSCQLGYFWQNRYSNSKRIHS